MNAALISALIDKNAFLKDTIITADYSSMDLFGRRFNKTGEFKVRRILRKEDTPIFELSMVDDRQGILQAPPESIRAIDGMDVMRYADIYDLHPDGSNKKVGRKRGRKPKHLLNT